MFNITYEEKLNSLTHYFGMILWIIGSIFLIIHARNSNNLGYLVGSIIYAFGSTFIYAMSGTYHILKPGKYKNIFKTLDHIAIYISISASYMPFLLGYFNSSSKWIIFFAQWGITFLGIIFKIFYVGRFNLLSTFIYLALGWMAIFVIGDLSLVISKISLIFLITSGITYSIGTIFYLLDKKLKYSHVIWHIFVLLGGGLMYLSIYFI